MTGLGQGSDGFIEADARLAGMRFGLGNRLDADLKLTELLGYCGHRDEIRFARRLKGEFDER